MAKQEAQHKFWNIMRDGLGYTGHMLSRNIVPSIVEGAEMIVNNLDDKVVKVEKRMVKKAYTFSIICFGALFLILALFFYLKESLNWSSAFTFFSIGIITFVAGLLFQIGGSSK